MSVQESPESGAIDVAFTAADNAGGIALCLSGGGFRATLFHLGVIRHLRDAGLLPKVEHICAVSGGSIAAAHIVRHWAGYTSTKEENFDRVASELIDFVKLDVRGRIVRRLPFSVFYKNWRRSTLLRSMYATLYSTRPEDPRTPRPQLHLLATNLTHGCLCSFESDRVILYHKRGIIELPTETLHDDVKVAASSAFPAFFPPVLLTAEDLGVDKEMYLPDIQYYTDGGVYDNLGIRRLKHLTAESDHDPARRLSLLLVSDAGRPFGLDLTRSPPGILKTAWRSNDIALARIGELDQRELSDLFDGLGHGDRGHDPSRFRILSIDDEIPFAEGGNSLPINLQRLVKGIRTDLDSFSDQEIVFLVQHGYAVARHVLTMLSEECRQVSGEKPKLPIVQLMRTAKDVPNGRWLPPRTEPGWPRDKDQSAWDNDSDRVKLTKSIASLKHSGDIRLRLFSFRDHVSLMTLACVLAFALTVGTCGVLLRARASAIPHILYSNLGGNLDTTLFEVDPSMPGVEISERVVDVDIRNEVPVREVDLDNLRVSPSVHTYTIKGVRRETSARYLVYEFSSQRRLMDAVCITPQRFQVRYRQDPAPGGDGFDNVYTIIISLDQQSPDIPFNVTFRMTRWNAYQASNNNYVGALVSGDENLVRLNVLLPHGRHYRSANVQERPQKAGAKWTDVDSGRASMPVPTSDKTGFTWTLQSPRKGWAHRAMIVWD